eukprot:6660107-Pyramimonas_sp.AAC.1
MKAHHNATLKAVQEAMQGQAGGGGLANNAEYVRLQEQCTRMEGVIQAIQSGQTAHRQENVTAFQTVHSPRRWR